MNVLTRIDIRRLSRPTGSLAGMAILFCLLFGSGLPAGAAEILRNADFSLNLQHWRKAADLASWLPVSGSTLDLYPDAEYRGDMLWQPLNVADPGGEVFGFQVDISRVEAEVGSAVSFSVEYVDQAGTVQRAPLSAVSNTLAPESGWLTVKRQWLCPEGAQRLTRFLITRNGPGHLRMRNPSLTHDLLENGPIPSISGVDPASGPYPTLMTITGQNFGATPGTVYIGRTGNDSWYTSTELNVLSWNDTTITARIYEPTPPGELTVVTGQKLENSESVKFTITSRYFTLKPLTPKQSASQSQILAFTFELVTGTGGSGYPGGISFMLDDLENESAYTVTPSVVYPGAGATEIITVTVDTGQLPAGRHIRHLQSLEDSSYARFAEFEFDTAPRGEGPMASAVTEFTGDGSILNGMGLPRHRVNLATLDLSLEARLFRMKTNGPPIRLDLWFLGRAAGRDGLFGEGWRLNYESAIDHDDYSATLFTINGKILRFTTYSSLSAASESAPVTLTPPDGNHDALICYGTHFDYVEKSTKVHYRYEQTASDSPTAYLTRITDRNGQMVMVQTDLTTGKISTVTDEAGRSFTLVSDGDDHCTSVQAPDGRAYTFGYLQSRLSTITDPRGYQGTYNYNTSGFMTLMSAAGKQTTFTYANRPGVDGDKYVQRSSGPDGRQISYAFKTGESGVTLITDSRGNVRTHHHQGGKPTIAIDPTGELRQIGYENDRPVALIDTDGATQMEYDARNNLTRVVDSLGGQTVMAYDADDNLVSRTDALNNTWTYEYDTSHNLIKATDPLAGNLIFTRDNSGRITGVTDQRGKTRHIGYDSWGNPARYTDELGNVTTFTYGSSGMRLSRVTDANGDYKIIQYDPLDRVTKVSYLSADGTLLGERLHQWNGFGETKFTNELGQISTSTRNVYGQSVSVTDPLGATTSYEYDTSGNRIESTDPLGRIFTTEFDGSDRIVRTLSPLSQETLRSYDASGRLKELRDPQGNRTSWSYDARGNMITERDALGERVGVEYDALGRPSRRFTARNQEIQYSYDSLGRMTRKLYYSMGVQYDYTFDALGNLTSMTGPDGTTFYDYTDRGELSAVRYGNGAAMAFTYDASGQPATITYPDGLVVGYQYDRFNRIPLPEVLRNTAGEFTGYAEPPKKPIAISWTGGGVSMSYNAAANPVTISRSNGVGTILEYDGAARCQRISHTKNGSILVDMALLYNLAGELVQQRFSDTVAFPEAPAGSGTFNALNQISAWNSQVYSYDKDGNLTHAGGRFTAQYDAENHLVSLTREDKTITFGYNGLEQRVSRSGDDIRHYLYDRKGRLLCITDSAGAVMENIIYAGDTIVALGSQAVGYRYPLFDIAGNIVALTNAAGEVGTSYRYLPFGTVRRAGTDDGNPFSYSGVYGVIDEGEGLYAMRRRFYDALRGKFLQRDPIGISGGVNLYAYSDNNPLIKSDPGGENPILAAGFILWAGYRAYNAWGTAKHGANALEKGGQTIEKAKKTADSYGRMKQQAENLGRLNNQAGNSLEDEIARQNSLHDARQDTFNQGVDLKDNALDTAGTAAQAAYHGARFIQGLGGAVAPEPPDAAGKIGEALTDGSFNELDENVINWETLPDPFE